MSAADGEANTLGAHFKARNDIVSIVRRRLKVAALVFLCVFGSAIAALVLITPRYLATGSIIVAEPTSDIDTNQPVGMDKVGDPADLESQILVLKSSQIIRDMLENPAIRNAAIADCRNTSGGLLAVMAGGSSARCDEQEQNRFALVEWLQQRMSVVAAGRSRVINVSYESIAPPIAQTLVNGLVDTFLEHRNLQFSTSKDSAGGALQRELEALDRELRGNEQKIQSFRSKNHLIRGTIAPVSTEQLSSVAQALTQAEAAKAAAFARLQDVEKARHGNLLDNPVVAGSRAIGDLKQQLIILDLQIAHDGANLGPRHPAMISLGEMRETLMSRIRAEMDSIANSSRDAYETASTFVSQLRAKMSSAETEAETDADEEASIAGLVRNVEAGKAKYAELSRQLTEVQSRKPPFADSTRLLSKAELPVAPYFPKRLPFVAGGFVLALMLAAFAAVAADRLDPRLRTTEAVTVYSGLPVLTEFPFVRSPVVSGFLRRAIGRDRSAITRSMRHCWNNADYRTALNDLTAAVLMKAQNGHAFKIAIVSPCDGEGRTHSAIALAEALAESGKRVLLIEADLRHPTIARALSLPGTVGLSDILKTQSAPEGHVHRFGQNELYVLPAGSAAPSGASAFLSPHMAEVMRFAGTFDIVVFDTPPVLGSKDAAAIARLADTAIVCSRWAVSRADDLQVAITEIEATGHRPLGVVTTMVDLQGQSLYERRPRSARATRRGSVAFAGAT